MGALLSVLGLYNYDNTLFDRLVLPEGVDKDIIIENILSECAEVEVLYSDPEYMKYAIGVWSNKELPTWYRLLRTSELEYNPLYNVDATEYTKETRDLKQNETGVNTSNDTSNSSNTHKVNGFNESGLTDAEKDEASGTNASSLNTNINKTDKGDIITEHRRYGNIGVTMSQQLVKAELDLVPELNVINYIIDSFRNRFCLLVY